ncbi:MAG: pyridoxal-phosphate dependent enzyme [Bacteroidetes bacterium]|nr:pyridoxal-phosphate dependent enzyme [Bacteroidota bacterium]
MEFQTLPNRQDIVTVSHNIRPFIHRTPILTSENLNTVTDAFLYFKCENFQKAGAFKSRGATNAVFSLKKQELIKGVCTHSSGNHAAALSRAAGLRNAKAYIVMPENSSRVKIAAVKHYGGKITFCKPNLKSREDTLKEVIEKTGAIEIHPYNDYRIIAGQATAAQELIEDIKDLDIILAPVGGGGLLSGTALAAKYFAPNIQVMAAEPAGADDAYRSFYEGRFIPSNNPNTIADGLLTSMGTLTYPIIQQYVSDILRVSENSIVTAMKLIWERMKIIVEPSSAVPFAAILENHDIFAGKRTGIIISGGNVDLQKLPWN